MTALLGISTRLRLARLFFMTSADAELAPLAAAAARGGADAVICGDRARPTGETLAALDAFRAAVPLPKALVGYAGSPGVAAAFAADLYLLPDDHADAARAHGGLSAWAKVGRSCNSAAEVDAALADAHVDFLLVGPGLDHIRHAAAVAPPTDPAAKPWFAAGGITGRTLDVVLRAGAMRVAVGRGIGQAPDAAAAAAVFADRLRAAWASEPRMDAVRDAAFASEVKPIDVPRTAKPPQPTDLTL